MPFYSKEHFELVPEISSLNWQKTTLLSAFLAIAPCYTHFVLKRCFTESISFHEKNTQKAIFQSKIVKGNTFDMFPPFLHCLPQKRTFESGRYFHLKCQASGPILASKTLFYPKYQFSRENTRKSHFSV